MMIDIDLTKSAEELTDDELADVLKLAELMEDARKEHQRRLDERDPNISESRYRPTSVKVTTEASCPTCGKNDSFSMTRLLYTSWEAAHDGERPTRAVLCKCGTWYNASTGERMEDDQMRKMFQY